MVAATAVEAAPFIPALSPAEALQAFRVEPGLRVELVAAEPLVVDPVAFAFDDHGRLFVVESRGYPGEVKKDQSQSDAPASTLGRIALLEDRDGDGRFETRTEFATGLTFPNGILPWRGGVFVTCAPDIYFLKDNDGDGVADERSVVLTGFSTSRTTQIRVSHPTLGLEGKVYVTSGLNGGKVIAPLHPERPAVTFTPADGRFDPATLVFETTGGRAQFGLSIDDFGRRFICSNRHPVMQVVLEPWHLRRNPHLAFAETVQNVSRVEAEAVVWPISRASVTAEFIPSLMTKPHNGTFTAASGVLEFGGTGLGEQFVGSVFICESAQNLVQRQVLRPAGASFRAEPARVGLEFLASTDVWFRPVSLGEGPDGALYLADMYRREIDHPAYVPEESRGQLDFLSGSDRGRIYRVIREAAVPRRRVRVGSSAAELVRDLESPDRWWRERAQRLLVERADPASVPLVEQVARAATQPAARSRALWTLAGLERLSPALLLAAFADSAAPVREQAVLLAASRIASSPELAGALIRSAADADARVRFCAALALGSWPDQRALAPLAAVAAQDGEDRWARAAVLSGVGGRLEAFRAAFAAQHAMGSAAAIAPVMEDLGRICGAGASTAERARFLAETLGAPEEAPWRVPAVLGLAEGLRTRGEFKNKPAGAALTALTTGAATGTAAGASLEAFFRRAAAVAASEAAPLAQRTRAVALLGHTEYSQGAATFGPLLESRQAPELQLQVVRALERIGEARGAELLVEPKSWNSYTPPVREAAIAALVSKPPMLQVLFAAIRRGDVRAPEISSVRRTQLLQHANAGLRAEATALFQSLEGGDRMAIYREYRELLKQPGPPNAAAGAAAYERACSACHTFRGAGGKVGPDLTGVRNQPADALLLHILVPNYEVAPAYQAVTATTQDGRTISGWLVAETEAGLTLRTAAGPEETVLRKSLASLTASGVSLMPDGLELTMTKAELLALIAYLKSEAN